ncbi:DUF5719 family protein [Pseudarthrobacter raffinosi]|uniref:DUF5719 family protein n=1 Tax=Pseudarthrobacter raffinosi TaxID=2953651 RepID=UPI00208F1C07|nr:MULTISPECIES: DUF5719 family protein [unclassified Pseudarthrobacter]MCO4238501.1 DUF5719 family protein [Pseudarthrobacter sp. MDT3-28]MCO4249705.1 DUF5719 family protein [Pseudarthrobacter sp. MDT3-9]MCO4262277.1 DUF5719 family protein [Pseudarthrobacter sp. MDT3-26]
MHKDAARRTPRKQMLAGLVSAVAIVATAGAGLAASSVAPQPAGSRSIPAVLAAVPAGASTGVCPGPARLLEGTEAGTDPQFSPESATAKSAVTGAVLSAPGGVLPGSRLAALDGTPAVEIAKDGSQPGQGTGPQDLTAGVVAGHSVDDASFLSADAQAGQKPSAAGLMRFTATDGDLQGSAAANCQPPANDLWLSGASTTVGRTSLLVLSNASSTPATVSLELFGSKGQIRAPGSRGLLVAPGGTRSIVLAGLAPGEAQLTVHVRSAGGPVAASIQQSVLRGLTPGGVDFIAPGAAPAARQVMTGVDIQDAGAISALTGNSGFNDAGPALAITVPGPSDAVVEVKLFGRDGQKALPGGGVVTAKAGSVTEISLAGVPAGHYTVSTSSDVSFVAATRVTRGVTNEKASDVAWAASGVRLGSQHVVPVPHGGDRTLVFGVLENRATVSYAAITADGKIRAAATADVAGGTTTSIKVPEKVDESVVVAYVVSASGDAAYGALLLQQDGRDDISTVAFTPAASGQEKVPVSLGY